MFTFREGKLLHNGRPFFSVGVNYHPSAAGCHYWQVWDATRIAEDLEQMARRGFNTVRFFLFWADFEPMPGQYDSVILDRLKEFVGIARRYRLQCIPSLLTIWMNGQLFDLPWRNGRDLWIDQEMLKRERAYVQQIASVLCESDNILAYDLGDEIIHVDSACSQVLPRATVSAWLNTLAAAIRQVHPEALVIQANEASAIIGTHQFRPENATGLDLLAIHGYPVWSPFAIESLAGYKASCFVPFLAAYTRAYGPVLVDELGSYGAGQQTAGEYFQATSYSLLANGATGVIAWCWQDFSNCNKPYALRPGERFVGLLDTQGTPKPAMAAFAQFAHLATTDLADLMVEPAPIGVYLPDTQHNGVSYLQSTHSNASAAFYAYLLLKRAHLPFEFTQQPLPRHQLIICPSMNHITLHEQELLMEYVVGGGTLYYSTADYLHGFGGEALFGVQLQDFTLQADDMNHFCWQGHEYSIEWPCQGETATQIPILAATTATVLARYPNGTPALTRQTHGAGVAYYLNAPFETQLNRPFRLASAAWQQFYASLAQAAAVRRMIDTDHLDLELAVLVDSECRYDFVINHSHTPVAATVHHQLAGNEQRSTTVRLAGKGVQIMPWRRKQDPSETHGTLYLHYEE